MNKSPRLILWFIIILTLTALWIDLPKMFPIKLGLDLQGGSELILLADTSKISDGQKDASLESAKEVIERRVNLYGVSEALVQTSKLNKERRIIVELPGIKDASSASELVGKTAQLDFRELPATPSAEATISAKAFLSEFKKTGLTGADLVKSSVTFGSSKTSKANQPQVALEFSSDGAKKFGEITRRNVGKPLAIFLDDEPITLNPPIVQTEIVGGSAVITGNYTVDQAKALSIQLNAGALPIPIKILEQRSIGASLGAESVKKSISAGIIGLILVLLYMGFYYGRLGLVANLALIIYSVLTLAIFKTGLFLLPPVTLTLAGIAGFILSIGMAVDANILIFERMKEEKRAGNSNKVSLELGFSRAWTSIRDSNISSLITASILYFMGTGLIRGFALTLAIGVLVSMFTAITVTRTFLRVFYNR